MKPPRGVPPRGGFTCDGLYAQNAICSPAMSLSARPLNALRYSVVSRTCHVSK